jgi:hypothetical protein
MSAFPHRVYPSETFNSVSVAHTIRVFVAGSTEEVAEIDCVLYVALGRDGCGSLIWQVETATFGYGCNAPQITANDDPAMWEIIRRSVMARFTQIDNELHERAKEAA